MEKINLEQHKSLIELADSHAERDEYISGSYGWHTYTRRDVRTGACAIGCTIHDAIAIGVLPTYADPCGHDDLSELFGLTIIFWKSVDSIFERLSKEERCHRRGHNEAQQFTPRVLRAIRLDGDYSNIDDEIFHNSYEIRCSNAAEAADLLINLLASNYPKPRAIGLEW